MLGREPGAVEHARAELGRVRGRAAAAGAFELAGRVQAEIQGLDWISGPQRVTVGDGGDLDVHGWADGVLVCFGVRDGRLCEWSQGRCSESQATDRVAATPAGWRPFARRNAELAAALERAAG